MGTKDAATPNPSAKLHIGVAIDQLYFTEASSFTHYGLAATVTALEMQKRFLRQIKNLRQSNLTVQETDSDAS